MDKKIIQDATTRRFFDLPVLDFPVGMLMFTCSIGLALIGGLLPLSAAEPVKLPLDFTIQAGDKARTEAPVVATLPGLSAERSLRLREVTAGKNELVASQWETGTPPRLWWVAHGVTPAGTKRTYRLEAGEVTSGAQVVVDRQETFVEVRVGNASVLKYNSAHVDPPAGIDPRNGRSAYIHPAWTPAGKVVTEQFPSDHAHQSGVFLAHTKSEFEGRELNFWDLLGGRGRVRFKGFQTGNSGPVFGEFRVEHEHVDMTVPNGKVAALETWDVRAWNVGGAKSGYWVWDITSSLRCASSSPLRLLQYHYGGMAIRGSGQWAGQNAHFVTSEGKGRIDGNHSRPTWCDLSGPVDGSIAGITLLSHPNNFRFPEPLRIHPTMPYMVYTPSQLGDWELTPGSTHVSRYRFIVHDGDLTADTVNNLGHNFAEPLVASR